MADCEDYEMEWGDDDDNQMNAGENGSEGEIEIENNFYEAEGIYKTDK